MYFRELLFDPNPFLFFDDALTVKDLPDFMPFMVQVVFSFFIVQDLPPAVTLLPVTLDPPFDVGREIVIFTLTIPFFTEVDSIVVTVGAEGLLIFDFAARACDGLNGSVATSDIVKIRTNVLRT